METFFSSNGRLNRRAYFFRGLALSIPSYLLLKLPKAWGMAVAPGLHVLFIAIALAAMIAGWLQTIKRLHDLDKSGWYSLLLLIPFVNFVFGLYILFKKGADGRNQYGDDPLLKYTDNSQQTI